MLSAQARCTVARIYAVSTALYGVGLLLVALLINAVVGGARFEIPAYVILGVIMLALASVIWRQVAYAMLAAPIAGVIGWLAFGRPTIFFGMFIMIPLIFAGLAALCLWPGTKRG